MNFFEHQAEARRLSRQLIALFVVAVVAIVIAVDFIVVVALALMQGSAEYQSMAPASGTAHGGVIAITSIVVLSVIAIASFYKANTLRAGGAAVAISLGGERVHRNTTDLLHKRLLNVVEEMAIASGVPVPEVFVLEQEQAINAFTAGHTPANAAIAVTRGALDNLNRNELQAVIAHEFSHVLNGDMRINTRLIGLLFGILVIAIAGRMVLRFSPRSSGGRKNGGAIAAIFVAALALMIVGYVGLLFGRLIQAAVSRSRERLADASAVQFTRDPHGLRGALVKIGAVVAGSRLQNVAAEEVAHLLFASGTKRWFATHPPLEERIRTIDPSFQAREFDQVRAALLTRQQTAEAESEAATEDSQLTARGKLDKLVATTVAITPAVLTQLTAPPGAAQLAMAQTLRASLPKEIEQAGHDAMQATAMVLALSLDDDVVLRAQQIKLIEMQLGLATSERVTRNLSAVRALAEVQRQPALLHLLSALRPLDSNERTQLLVCLNGLLQRAGAMSVGRYTLRKLAQVHLHDAARTPPAMGRATLHGHDAELALLLSVLAHAGHSDAQQARGAYESGMQLLLPRMRPEYALATNWAASLDLALSKLDLLMPAAKDLLLQAMTKTIAHDGVLAVREAELLRAVCATLHCPVPPLVGQDFA